MKKAAVSKAKTRLERAQSCLFELENSTNFKEFESAWSDLLITLNRIYSVLEFGARTSDVSREWYNKKKKERKDDPLLQYMHQARNADEHGIEPVAFEQPGSVSVNAPPGGITYIKHLEIGSNKVKGEVWSSDPSFDPLKITHPKAILLAVKDERYGDVFSPPKEHLGTKLSKGSPLEVAQKAVAYHESLVEEAERLSE